ncbi:MAG TPA: hypothetical protein VMF03_20840 [Steroidobacteraceae bacterium]|nr:hypothetical protein [Steroidobacteraceae bacterium]
MIVRTMTLAVALTLCSAALSVRAQVVTAQEAADLSGSWDSPATNDVLERDEGPFTDDFVGMPLNAAGRALAASYSADMLAEPERVCQLYDQWHYSNSVFNLRIWPVTGGPTGTIQAWKLQPTEDNGGMTIWMDGRSPPSEYADHLRGAFTTGHWKGDMLIAVTTGMKRAPARDNGAFHSDESIMTSTFIPHDDMLTIVYVLHDPVYMTAPYVYSRTYVRSVTRPIATQYPPCIVNFEGTSEGTVPFFPPGKNPLMTQMMEFFHVPEYASAGGADTMYPEFRDRLKAQYLKLYPTFPKKCTQYCTNFRFQQAVGNLPQPVEGPAAKPGRRGAKSGS